MFKYRKYLGLFEFKWLLAYCICWVRGSGRGEKIEGGGNGDKTLAQRGYHVSFDRHFAKLSRIDSAQTRVPLHTQNL